MASFKLTPELVAWRDAIAKDPKGHALMDVVVRGFGGNPFVTLREKGNLFSKWKPRGI